MVRKYRAEDFEQIKAWGKAWGSDYESDLFPPLGFIVPGVCAYFIYETPSKVCWLENMVANPDVPKEVRDLALNAVVTECLREVSRLGYRKVYATSNYEAVIKRAQTHNAKVTPGFTQITLAFNQIN